MTPEYAITPAWLQAYRNPMDGSRKWFHHEASELPLAEGASQKYSENGEVKQLDGLSLVTFVDPQSELFQKLRIETQQLQEAYRSAGLDDVFAFLPSNTWHITIADIVTTSDKELRERAATKINSGYSVLRQEQLPAPRFYFRSDFVVSAGISIVCLAEPKSEQDLLTIRRIRQALVQEVRPLGIPMQDPERFIGHLTLAYFKKRLGPEEYQRFKQVMQDSDQSRRLLGELFIQQVELRRFASMEDWGEKPMAILQLNP